MLVSKRKNIISRDQMPLHRNESSGQAKLSFKNHEAFVEENHHLSRERVIVFTQIATNDNTQLVPEFAFKGTGKHQPKLTPLSEHTISGLTKVDTVHTNF